MDTLEDHIGSIVGDTELDRLAHAVAKALGLVELGDNLVGHYVDSARRAGIPWSAIGDTLGLSKQGAQQRFAPRGPLDAAHLDGPEFSRFTDRARRALAGGRDAAIARGDDRIDPGHVVLGICGDSKSLAARALVDQGTTLALVRREVRATLPAMTLPGSIADHIGEPAFSSQTRVALDAGLREALRFGHDYIGTEHLVLGLMSQDRAAATVALNGLGVTYPGVREAVDRMLRKHGLRMK